MADSSIPAWKRAGLQQVKRTLKQSETAYDPLKEGLKRANNDKADGQKEAKPAKRVKLPKAERPDPVHELDQLAYLRQFSEDRENWKFSKQKQNWILKHMFTDAVGDQYQEPLLAYVKDLMGSARGWAVDDANDTIKAWNEFMREDIEKKDEKEADDASGSEQKEASRQDNETRSEPSPLGDSAQDNGTAEGTAEPTSKKAKRKPKKKAQEPVKKPVSERMARRAQQIVQTLTGETPTLEFLDTASS